MARSTRSIIMIQNFFSHVTENEAEPGAEIFELKIFTKTTVD